MVARSARAISVRTSPFTGWQTGKAKLLQAEWGVSATNRRVRLYRITPAGRKHLAAQVSSFEQMLAGISLVLGLGGDDRNY